MNNLNSVFVVDEDLSARRGIARLLRTAGYDVRDFSSANEFLEALGHETPGCAVLAAELLEVVVHEMQMELGVSGSDLPIIIVTAHDDRQSRRQALRLNAIGYFRKPIDGTALLDAIAWAMQKSLRENNHEKT
ncbi:MAG: response regulator [Anaerolineaceae bacterium]|nr:MAG: response regulator [Anaerolineaceae bacterium]